MSKALRGLATLAIGAAMQGGLSGLAFAQGSPVPANAPALSGASTPPYGDVATAPSDEPALEPEGSPATDLPVLYVTSVEVLRTTAKPRLDIVRVTGLAASQGWSAPQLVPMYAGKPADGIVDLQFVATPPTLSQAAEGFVPIDAIFPVDEGHPFKGVRVRASENDIIVTQLPGGAQTTISANGCADCIGKKLIAGGAAQPAQPDTIRQADLPSMLRVIRPSDGVRGTRHDPNRLTLVLGEDGTIVEAFWE
jgi:hypothetical protein